MDTFSVPGNWTAAEHEAFLLGLEQHGQGSSHPDVWQKIAKAVGTKTAAEVKTYAHNYFIKLQAESYVSTGVAASHAAAAMGGSAQWSLEEEFVFEAALANVMPDAADSEGGVVDFARIAQLLPGKRPADVEARYRLLLDDVANIEDGEDIAVVYYGVQGAKGPPNTPNARGRLQYLQGLIAQQQQQLEQAGGGGGGGGAAARMPEKSPEKKIRL